VPYKDGSILGPILPRERVLEHYESHVLRCPDCQKGLQDLRKQQRAALAAGKSFCCTGGTACALKHHQHSVWLETHGMQ